MSRLELGSSGELKTKSRHSISDASGLSDWQHAAGTEHNDYQGDGPIVVVTAMPLSIDSRAKLQAALGDSFVVYDIRQAAPAVDILVIPPTSPSTTAAVVSAYPSSQVIVVELRDNVEGIDFYGATIGHQPWRTWLPS